jgi:basic membrane protein A
MGAAHSPGNMERGIMACFVLWFSAGKLNVYLLREGFMGMHRRQAVQWLVGSLGIGLGMPFAGAATQKTQKKVVFAINGTLGDKSFFDLGAAGMQMIQKKYGSAVQTKIVEMGVDRTRWQPTLEDLSNQDWDLIVVCTYEISDILSDVATDNPRQSYVLFDGVVSYDKGADRNVASIAYKQNEASYLAGMLAAGLIRDGAMPGIKGKSLGFLGGMDIPVINDYLVGYVAGARAVNPDVKIAVSYAGTFADAAKGKELALAQYSHGTAIGFNVAGQTGLGQLAAAKDALGYAIGVNSDQEAIFRTTDPGISSRIITSVLKRVDVTTLRAFEQSRAGTLARGRVDAVGLAENAVGLVEDGNMAKMASPALKQQIAQAKAAIIAANLKVPTAFGMSTAALGTLRASVRPS